MVLYCLLVGGSRTGFNVLAESIKFTCCCVQLLKGDRGRFSIPCNFSLLHFRKYRHPTAGHTSHTFDEQNSFALEVA
jgi:hypothetical protein